MTAKLIDGKAIAASVRAGVKERVEELIARTGIRPGLTVVLVGEDPASQVYVRNKGKAASEAGILSRQIDLPASTPESELLDLVARLNADDTVHGILVQLPLPKQIDESKVIEAIDPAKDVDGFHPVNAGRLFTGGTSFLPCTPYGILTMLDYEKVELKGKHAVVVGRSNIVGKPVAILLLSRHATVTICHSRTVDLPSVVRTGDVVVAAVGRAEMIRGSWIKPGAVVIDVGMNLRRGEGGCGAPLPRSRRGRPDDDRHAAAEHLRSGDPPRGRRVDPAMQPPPDRRYSRSHAWAMPGVQGDVRSGLTHVPGAFLGDVVSVELPPPRTEVSAGEPIGLVESTTTVFELLSPLSGIVVAVNPETESAPRKVTEDPYGEGWLLSIRPSVQEELDALLTAEEYVRFVGEP
jgi:methylenetetrahydrofolate dehydrogenase (NADP+)/methenyltetrahydrofolate cyclohydrolase